MSHAAFFEKHPIFAVRQADAFAERSHRGMRRRYTGFPYITHPRAVARMLTHFEHDTSMLCAALLHDVVEDCGVSVQTIAICFGSDVAILVEDLTAVSKPADGNRARRKAIDLAHTAAASPRAKTIKCLDAGHNALSFFRYDPAFGRVWLAEKRALLPALEGASDPKAFQFAARVIEDAWRHVQG